jgi:CRP/FNR family cyclic AMP-dependent transcriptional regulator
VTNLAINLRILRTVPIFALFSDHQLATLVPAIQHRSYPRRSFILHRAQQTDALYVILGGRAKVVIDNGDRELTVTTIGPSEFFGEMSLIDEKPRSASVQAVEACEVLCVSRQAFMVCLKDNFDVAMLMLRSVVGRLRNADDKIASLALMDVHGRVARLIIEEAKLVDGSWVVDIGSEEIGRIVGASREMVSRVVRAMVANGLIRRDGRKLVVLDSASMNQRSQPGE